VGVLALRMVWKNFYLQYIEPLLTLLLHIGFMVLLASLPLSKGTSSVTLGIMLGFCVIRWLHNPAQLQVARQQINALSVSMWLFWAAYLVGLLYTNHFGVGIKTLYKQNAFLLIPILIMANRQLVLYYGAFYLKWFVWGAAFAGMVIIALYSLPADALQNIAPKLPRWGLNKFPVGVQAHKFGFYTPFIDRLSMGYFIGLSVLSSLWLWVSGRFCTWFTLLLLGIFFMAATILGGRGGQLALLAALSAWAVYGAHYLITGVWNLPRRIALPILVAIPALLILLLPWALFTYVPVVWERYNQLFWELSMLQNNTYQQYNYEHFTSLRRIYSWVGSWELVKNAPLLGVGTGDYRFALESVYKQNGWNVPVNAHHQFLQIWATIGLYGLAAFIGIMAVFLRRLFTSVSGSLVWIFGVSVVVFYLVIFQFDSPLNMQASGMCFVLLLWLIYLQATKRV